MDAMNLAGPKLKGPSIGGGKGSPAVDPSAKSVTFVGPMKNPTSRKVVRPKIRSKR